MSNKLFLGGIALTVTKEDIEAHFSQYGVVTDAIAMYKDGKPRGFGFVTFESADAVDAVFSEPQMIHDKVIDVKSADGNGGMKGGGGGCGKGQAFGSGGPAPWHSQGCGGCGGGFKGGYGNQMGGKGSKGGGKGGGKHDPKAACKVFIGGLPATCTDDMLSEYFSRFGTLEDVVVMKDKMSNKSRGFGFVRFDNPDPVELVMQDYSTHEIDGKWIEVKRAVPQDQIQPKPFGMPMMKGGFGGGKGPGPSCGGYGMQAIQGGMQCNPQFVPWGGPMGGMMGGCGGGYGAAPMGGGYGQRSSPY